MTFIASLKKRRSIYALGREIKIPDEKIVATIQDVVRESPSAFNSQTSRVVILFGAAHQKLWEITANAVSSSMRTNHVPEAAVENSQKKIAGFGAAYGSALFFEDAEVVKNLQEKFALYAENFPKWSEQSTGIAANNVWVALAEIGIGANLQHYNPLIDAEVAKNWQTPTNWILRGQLVFGSVSAEAPTKEFIADASRFRVFR